MKNEIDNLFNDKNILFSEDDIQLSIASLQIALKAYFSTYHCLKGDFYNVCYYNDNLQNDIFKDIPKEDFLVEINNREYSEQYIKCILHFQHFAELVCKGFLYDESKYLIYPCKKEDHLLEKYINGNEDDIKNYVKYDQKKVNRTVSFELAIKRLVKLIDENKLKNHEQVKFIKDYESLLEKLVALRNSVWHRGLEIYNYDTLDTFVGKYILPFVDNVLKHPKYKTSLHLWKYKDTPYDKDPLILIIKHFKDEDYDRKKVALLKELCRATYNIPYWNDKMFWEINYAQSYAKLVEEKASIAAKGNYFSNSNGELKVLNCPVCNIKSLIIYEYVEPKYEYDENGMYPVDIEYSYPVEVKCECCSFGLYLNDIEDVSKYEIEGINYW